jgi:hypothetical protein
MIPSFIPKVLIKPHCRETVVEINGIRYYAEFKNLERTYTFICLDWEKGYPPMHEKKKSEIDVSNAIKKGIIKII